MKKIIYLLTTFLILCGITSCNNFMNGSDLIQEIDDILAEANAPEVEVLISADASFGTTAPNGKYLYKVNKKYPLMVQISSDEYTFKNWEAVNRETGEVLPDAVTFDDPSQLETNFKINYEITNLWIRPKCIQYPRIIDFSPKNKAGGVICYTPIEIFFNMAISSEEVVDTFDNIKIEIDQNSVIDYFNTPVLSEDGKKITIKPKPAIKDLVANVSFLDITVSVSDAIKSADNPDLHIEQYSNVYRINSSQDTTPPAIKSVVISKDKEQTAAIQKNADYNNWQSSDIEYNHINNSVWISCNAIDSDSGIDSIIITETVVNNADGSPRNQILPEIQLSKEFNIVNSEEFSLDAFEYKLSTDINALVKLNIKVKDRAGYYSTNDEFNYYVVAEPVFINDAVLKFDIARPDNEGLYENVYKFANNGIEEQNLKKIVNFKHNYYLNNYSKVDVKVYSWDGIEEPEQKTIIYSASDINANDIVFNFENVKFSRNANMITTVKMIINDSLGHSYEQIYKIPRSPMIVDYEFDGDYLSVYIDDIFDSYYDETITYVIFYNKNGSDFDHIYTPYSGSQYLDGDSFCELTENDEILIGVSAYCYDSEKNNHTYGCSYNLYKFVYSDGDLKLKNSSSIPSGAVNFPSTVNVERIAIPEKGLFHYVLTYPSSFIPTQDVIYKIGYKNIIYWDDDYNYISNMDFYLEPYAGGYYYLTIIAVDKNGNKINQHDYGHNIDANSYYLNEWMCEIDDTFVVINSSDYISAPLFESEKSQKGYEQLKPNYCTLGIMNKSRSNLYDTTYYKTFESKGHNFTPRYTLEMGSERIHDHDTVLFDYFCLENSRSDSYRVIPYNDSLSNNFTNRMYMEIPNNNSLYKLVGCVPCNSAENSYYTMYGKIYDTNGTNTVKELGVASTYVYDSLPEVVKEGNDNIQIKVDKSKAEAGSDIKVKLYSVTDSDYWLESINTIENSTIGFANKNVTSLDASALRYKTQNNSTFDIISNLTTTNNFFNNRYVRFYIYTEPTSGANKEFMHKFYKTVYLYPNYYTQTITCNKKNFVEGANGLQFFIDQPTLVQTLYCKGNLGNDPDLWATKGIEADVRVLTSDCTYQPKTDDTHLPSGNYYCVVVHFADGTSCMSNVKYK